MRKVLTLAAALVLCAAPALAQQTAAANADAEAPAVTAAGVPGASAVKAQVPAPSIFVSTDEIRRQVRASQEQLDARQAQEGNQSWLYLVAAIVVGVLVAVLILD